MYVFFFISLVKRKLFVIWIFFIDIEGLFQWGFESKRCLIYNVLLYYLPEKMAKRHMACTSTSSTSTSTSVVNYWLPGRETGSGIICSIWPELTTSHRLPEELRVSELHRPVHRSTKCSISALNGSEAAKIGVRFIIFDICSSTRTILAWTRLSAFRRISPFCSADLSPAGGIYTVLDYLRYDTRCYFYVKSIAERDKFICLICLILFLFCTSLSCMMFMCSVLLVCLYFTVLP